MGAMRLGLIGLILLLIIIIANSVYIVTDKQTAILLRFGEIVDPKIESGLHFKVPILHTVRKFDSRVLTLDAIPQPYFTAEKKRLIVDAFVKWRITDNEQFYITSSGGQLGAMRTLLTQRVDEGLRNQFGVRTVQDVISGERDQLMSALTTDLNVVANQELGIEVIDVRVKKIELPNEVNDSEILKGEGDAQATGIYAKAFDKDPEFYEFTRSLNAYQSTFQNKSDVLLIDPESDFFKYLDSSTGSQDQE